MRSARNVRHERMREALRIIESGDPQRIIALLRSPESVVRLHVVNELARRRCTDAIPELIARLPYQDPDVRASIVRVLGELGDESIAEVFVELQKDQSENVRRLALRGLAKLGDPRTTAIATALYASGGFFSRQEAIESLVAGGGVAASESLSRLAVGERNLWWRHALRKGIRRVSKAATIS
jgi:hypothetical protein